MERSRNPTTNSVVAPSGAAHLYAGGEGTHLLPAAPSNAPTRPRKTKRTASTDAAASIAQARANPSHREGRGPKTPIPKSPNPQPRPAIARAEL